MTEIKDCPFCGNTPDIEDPNTFRVTQGGKWGALICCSEGPEVRTSYAPSTEWRKDAIKEWNSRPIEDAKDKRIAELEDELKESRHATSREIRNCLEAERELAEALEMNEGLRAEMRGLFGPDVAPLTLGEGASDE
jgi:hypothetical protein